MMADKSIYEIGPGREITREELGDAVYELDVDCWGDELLTKVMKEKGKICGWLEGDFGEFIYENGELKKVRTIDLEAQAGEAQLKDPGLAKEALP